MQEFDLYYGNNKKKIPKLQYVSRRKRYKGKKNIRKYDRNRMHYS